MKPLPRVPRLCPGGTVVCLGGGWSLTRADVDYVRGKADAVIAVNNAYELAPWADAVVAYDVRWWNWHKGAETFHGLKFTNQQKSADRWPGVVALRHSGIRGLDDDPSAIKSGENSGHGALNVAVHFGASRVVLLGYDMQPGPEGQRRFHRDHKEESPPKYATWLKYMNELPAVLKALGVEVANCTTRTALTCFPQRPLREVFSASEVAA